MSIKPFNSLASGWFCRFSKKKCTWLGISPVWYALQTQ